MLGLVVTDTLFRTHPDVPRASWRSSGPPWSTPGRWPRSPASWGSAQFLLLGRGEQTTGGRDKSSILADAMEAVIGVVYVQCGLEAAGGLVHRMLDDRMALAAALGAGLDWKTSLQELGARTGAGVPVYEVQASGPDHAKQFEAVVRVGDHHGAGAGASKKHAEQVAAAAAYEALSAAHPDAASPN